MDRDLKSGNRLLTPTNVNDTIIAFQQPYSTRAGLIPTHPAERKERQEERRCPKCDRKPEYDLYQLSKTARRLPNRKCQPRDDNDDHSKHFCHWPLNRLKDLLQRLLPGHV